MLKKALKTIKILEPKAALARAVAAKDLADPEPHVCDLACSPIISRRRTTSGNPLRRYLYTIEEICPFAQEEGFLFVGKRIYADTKFDTVGIEWRPFDGAQLAETPIISHVPVVLKGRA